MEVKDIIDLKTVKTNMNVNTKEEALKELANLLLENGNISDEKGFIKDKLYKVKPRKEFCSFLSGLFLMQ